MQDIENSDVFNTSRNKANTQIQQWNPRRRRFTVEKTIKSYLHEKTIISKKISMSNTFTVLSDDNQRTMEATNINSIKKNNNNTLFTAHKREYQ